MVQMSIPRALDYLYYRISWWNTRVIKDDSFLSMSNVFGVSALQGLNFVTIKGVILVLFFPDTNHSYRNYTLIAISIIIALNYFYYVHNRRHESIIRYYSSLSRNKLRRYDFILITYIACTFISLIIAIVIGRAHYAAPPSARSVGVF